MTAELFVKLSAQIYAEHLKFGDKSTAAVVSEEPLPVSPPHPQRYLAADGGSCHSSQSPSENSFDGGAKLSPETSEEDLINSNELATTLTNGSVNSADGHHFMNMSDTLPPAWHAQQLQRPPAINTRNPFSALANIGESDVHGGGGSGSEEEVRDQQWLPNAESSFWDPYVNKLRVNASEGGLCDLNEQFDEESE